MHSSTHPSTPPSLISAAAVLGALLLYYTAANEDSAALSRLWTVSLHFYSTYPLEQVLFHIFYLLKKLVQQASCKGGSYCTATLGEPGTSQVHRSSLKVQVQVWFLLDYFGDSGIYQFLVQVAALQTGRPSPLGRQSGQECSRRNMCAAARLRLTIANFS